MYHTCFEGRSQQDCSDGVVVAAAAVDGDIVADGFVVADTLARQ